MQHPTNCFCSLRRDDITPHCMHTTSMQSRKLELKAKVDSSLW